MNARFLSYLALTLAAAISLLFFSKPLADLIGGMFSSAPVAKLAPQTGQLVEVIGRVSYRRKDSAKFLAPARTPFALFHQDTVATGSDSLARIILTSGAEFSVTEQSEVLVEFFNPSDALSPVYVTIRRGLVDMKSAGLAGRLFFIRNKKLVTPAQLDQKERLPTITSNVPDLPQTVTPSRDALQTRDITQSRMASQPDSLADSSVDLSEDLRTALATDQPVIKISGQETLSSRYIETVLAARTSQFRRCQINSLRDRENALGRVLYSIKIQPSGKVTDIKVLNSTATSPLLQSCVSEIIARTTFEKFRGEAIALSYPIDFQ